MARQLVTGGAGFIGSHIVEALAARGDGVRVFDDFSTGKRENLAPVADHIEVVAGDLRDPQAVAQAVAHVDVVFHHAAFVSVPLSMQRPQDCFDVNVQGTINLLEAARSAGVKRVVLASSAAVYGESQAFPLRETTPLHPLSPYAASKQINDVLADLYTRAYGLPVVSLRYFNVYGPRQSPDSDYAAAIPIFTRQILSGETLTIFGDGGQSRDFVFVGDVVRANLVAAESPQAPGKTFNVCSGREVDLLELLSVLGRLLPDSPQPRFEAPRPGDIYRSLGDPTYAEAVLGFRAETPLAEGLARTLEWMRA